MIQSIINFIRSLFAKFVNAVRPRCSLCFKGLNEDSVIIWLKHLGGQSKLEICSDCAEVLQDHPALRTKVHDPLETDGIM